MTIEKISRRTLGGIAAAGAGLPLLAACGGNAEGSAEDGSSSTGASSASASSGDASSSAAGGEALAKTSDIKVGGGEVFADQQVVVTQPTAGQFKCFTAVCTHQGCLVSEVSDGTINCDCHGSQYSIEDGSVVRGPATFPLEAEKITVSGDAISLDS